MEIVSAKKRGTPRERKKQAEEKNRTTLLWLFSVSFLLGGILGFLAAKNLPTGDTVSHFLQNAQQEAIQPALWREVWVVFRWPALVAVLRFLPFAGRTIPVVIALRGFVLSYSISVFIAEGPGAWCAWLLYGPLCLLTVPVLFVLAEESLLRKADKDSHVSSFSVRALACLPALALCVFINQTVVPPLLTWYLSP